MLNPHLIVWCMSYLLYYMTGTVLGSKDVLQHEENMVPPQEAPRIDI